MWSHHRWIRAGFVLFVLGALGVTWAALGDFSRATDAAPTQPTCGCGQKDSTVVPHLAATGDGGVRDDLSLNVAAQEEGESFQLAIPTEVTIVISQSLVIITGKPTSISTIICAPGIAQPQSAVIIDQGGGEAPQNLGILIYADQPLRNGTRLRITSGGTACSSDLRLYTGVVE